MRTDSLADRLLSVIWAWVLIVILACVGVVILGSVFLGDVNASMKRHFKEEHHVECHHCGKR